MNRIKDSLLIPPSSAQSSLVTFALQEGVMKTLDLAKGVPADRKSISKLLLRRAKEKGKGACFIQQLNEKIEAVYLQ
jgi:hypothetical protein